jgi:hypothetical protein
MSESTWAMDQIAREIDSSCATVRRTEDWAAHELCCQKALEDLGMVPKVEEADRLHVMILIELGLARRQAEDWKAALRHFDEALQILGKLEEDIYATSSIKAKIAMVMISAQMPEQASRQIADLLNLAPKSIGVVAVFVLEIMDSVKDKELLNPIFVEAWRQVGSAKVPLNCPPSLGVSE